MWQMRNRQMKWMRTFPLRGIRRMFHIVRLLRPEYLIIRRCRLANSRRSLGLQDGNQSGGWSDRFCQLWCLGIDRSYSGSDGAAGLSEFDGDTDQPGAAATTSVIVFNSARDRLQVAVWPTTSCSISRNRRWTSASTLPAVATIDL